MTPLLAAVVITMTAPCAPARETRAALAAEYREHLVQAVPLEDGAAVEQWDGEASWTVLFVRNGVACVIAAGKGDRS